MPRGIYARKPKDESSFTKAKTPLTPEQRKASRLANLAKGRKVAAANRKLKATAKLISKTTLYGQPHKGNTIPGDIDTKRAEKRVSMRLLRAKRKEELETIATPKQPRYSVSRTRKPSLLEVQKAIHILTRAGLI